MLAFLESPRFNIAIRYGTVGSPEFNTDVSIVTSGAEQRKANWLESRGAWQLSSELYTRDELRALLAFFRERRGKAGGFRFKDWSDFQATPVEGQFETVITNPNVLQMVKVYKTGTNITTRLISKPVSGTITIYKNGVKQPAFALDYKNGLLVASGTGYSWSGQFDVPARFDTDHFECAFEGYRDSDGEALYAISSLPIVEIQQQAPTTDGLLLIPKYVGELFPPPIITPPITGGSGTGGTGGGVPVLDYYGASFVYGYDGAAGGGRVAVPVPLYLDTNTYGLIVNNRGVNSSSTTKALDGTNGVHPPWAQQMANTVADWIIIEYGLDDSFEISTTQFRANLRQMHSDAVATGKKVIFQTNHKIDPTFADISAYVQAMKDEAASLGIPCTDGWTFTQTAFTGDILTWVPDRYHPNQAGYNVIGSKVVDDIVAIIPGVSKVTSSSGAMPYGLNAALFNAMNWADEFDGTSLGSQWTRSIWYEADTGPTNYKVQDGSLHIWPADGYVDRTLTTDGHVYFNVGSYFEIEAKMPHGHCAPAFWLFNHEAGVTQTEIDILESGFNGWGYYGQVGSDPLAHTDYIGTVFRESGPTNWDVYDSGRMAGGSGSTLPFKDLSSSFNKFGVWWAADKIEFRFNGQVVKTILNPPATLLHRMFFLIQIWFNVGGRHGAWPAPDAINTPMGESNPLIVNYVRHWYLR
jgi:uncharacterized protein (TIGR02217 family)